MILLLKGALALTAAVLVAASVGTLVYLKWFRPEPVPQVRFPVEGALKLLASIRMVEEGSYRAIAKKDRNKDGEYEFGTLDELQSVDPVSSSLRRHPSLDAWEGEEYSYRVIVPADPEQAERYWGAVAWPSDPARRKSWPAFFTDQNGIFYEGKWTGEGDSSVPPLSALYTGEAYVSPVDARVWVEQRRLPKDRLPGPNLPKK